MGKTQYVDPHIVDSDGVRRLKRISFTDKKFNESWFQKLLFDNPSLLPTMDIEPAFSPCYSVAPIKQSISIHASLINVVVDFGMSWLLFELYLSESEVSLRV
jgi:hypothetical protein